MGRGYIPVQNTKYELFSFQVGCSQDVGAVSKEVKGARRQYHGIPGAYLPTIADFSTFLSTSQLADGANTAG